MTALKEYQRLESTGLWRESPDSQRREVVVSFGEATLSLSDHKDTAVAHWSLAAIHRQNKGEMPALYSPDETGLETLEITDADMAKAIDKILAAIGRYTPRPGRLRGVIVAATLAVVAVAAIWLFPPALARHTARVLPDVTRTDTGERLLGLIVRLSGERCRGAGGDYALANLRSRLSGPDAAVQKIVVVRSGVRISQNLPGGIVLLNRALVEDHEDPDVTAGFVLAEMLRAADGDPIERMLSYLGVASGFRMLTTGEIRDADLRLYAEHLLTRELSSVNDTALLESFSETGVRSAPYAYALDPTGETTLSLIEADPWQEQSRTVVLNDGDWIRLQNICSS